MDMIPGSSPKKLITRTNLNNPTLTSHSITTLFNPEYLMPSEERQQIKRSFSDHYGSLPKPIQRSRSTIIFNQDSLQKAESEFMNKKARQPTYDNISQSPSKKLENMQKAIGYSLPTAISNFEYLKKLNYGNFKSIKTKQNHGYDIINCIPSYKI